MAKARTAGMKILHDKDADVKLLKNKTISVIGYGSQGAAQAQCMRDSGLNVIVAQRPGSDNYRLAKSHGFTPVDVAEAAKKGDIVHILLPDEIQASVYKSEIAPNLKKGVTLGFSHGFSIVYGLIVPPKDADVILVAPKSPGSEERKRYIEGFGVPGLVAVEQNYTGKGLKTALAMAKAMGFTRAGVIETTFWDETTTDLFGEQAVLCGGLAGLIEAGFETLVDAGYAPEIAYFECLHETKLITDLIYNGGIEHMWNIVSNTAEYGGRTRGKKIINEQSRQAMKDILKDIQGGEFTREWINERQAGMPTLNVLRKRAGDKTIEQTGRTIRDLFETKGAKSTANKSAKNTAKKSPRTKGKK